MTRLSFSLASPIVVFFTALTLIAGTIRIHAVAQETSAAEATGKIGGDESDKAVRQGRSLFLGQEDGRILEAPASSVSPLECNADGTPVVRHLEYEVDGSTKVFVGPGQNVKVQAEYQNLPAAEQQPRATDAAVREAIFEMIAHPKRLRARLTELGQSLVDDHGHPNMKAIEELRAILDAIQKLRASLLNESNREDSGTQLMEDPAIIRKEAAKALRTLDTSIQRSCEAFAKAYKLNPTIMCEEFEKAMRIRN